MDEYAEYIYQRRPEYRHLSAGDVTAQKELRSNLNCKSFKWFMNEVAWDLQKFYPPVEPPAAAWGEVGLFKKFSCIKKSQPCHGVWLQIKPQDFQYPLSPSLSEIVVHVYFCTYLLVQNFTEGMGNLRPSQSCWTSNSHKCQPTEPMVMYDGRCDLTTPVSISLSCRNLVNVYEYG